MSHLATSTFQPLNIAILTVSDTRTLETDTSGQTLADALLAAGHRLHQRSLKTDDIYQIRAVVSAWIADPEVQVGLITGGTGSFGNAVLRRHAENGPRKRAHGHKARVA